jgi:hypothetical protein
VSEATGVELWSVIVILLFSRARRSVNRRRRIDSSEPCAVVLAAGDPAQRGTHHSQKKRKMKEPAGDEKVASVAWGICGTRCKVHGDGERITRSPRKVRHRLFSQSSEESMMIPILAI